MKLRQDPTSRLKSCKAIRESFRESAVIKGSVFLLRPVDGLAFVRAHEEQSIPIVGAEGFLVTDDGKIQPEQDESIDFGADLERGHARMIEFLQERIDSPYWYEIVPEWYPPSPVSDSSD